MQNSSYLLMKSNNAKQGQKNKLNYEQNGET